MIQGLLQYATEIPDGEGIINRLIEDNFGALWKIKEFRVLSEEIEFIQQKSLGSARQHGVCPIYLQYRWDERLRLQACRRHAWSQVPVLRPGPYRDREESLLYQEYIDCAWVEKARHHGK